MGYSDYDNAWLIALTRQRRAHKTVRASGSGPEFDPPPPDFPMFGCRPKNKREIRQWPWSKCKDCYLCGMRLTMQLNQRNTLAMDHRTPLALGGGNERWNLAGCCPDCNNRKGALTEQEYRAVLGRVMGV